MKKTYFIVSIFLSIIITSMIIFVVVSYTFKKEQQKLFDLETRVIDRIFSKKLRLLENVLKNFQILFHTVEEVDADMFNLFSNEILIQYDNLDIFTYSPLVTPKEKDKFEENRRDWGYFDYSIKLNSDLKLNEDNLKIEKYFPITYLEPFTPKKTFLFGTDIYNDPQNKEAIDKAIMTGWVTISKERDEAFSFFIPVYNGRFVPLTKSKRIEKINGIVGLRLKTATSHTALKIREDMNFKFEVFDDKEMKYVIYEKTPDYKSKIIPILDLTRNRGFNLDGTEINLQFNKTFYINDLDNKYIFISLFIFISSIFATYYFVKKHFEIKAEREEKLKKEKEILEANNLLGQQSKLASMGEMIMNIAHQWRQPLTVVSGNLVLIELLHERGKLTEDKLKDKINESSKQIEFMSKTIDDFRDFFKPNKNKEEFFLEEAIENTINLVKSTLKKHEIVVEKEIDSTIKIESYKSEFSQVILNLLNNSKDAFISNNIEDAKIKIRVRKDNGFIVTSVTDNAGGIKIEPIEKVFEPYVSTKHQSTGTGVGLYMCKMIIEKNMNGNLLVNNIENGTSFTISLNS